MQGLEINVESWNIDDADAQRLWLSLYRNNLRLSGLFLEFNFITDDGDYLARESIHRIGWEYLKANNGIFFTSNERHDIVQSPTNDVHEFTFRALADSGNAIARLESFGLVSWPCRDQTDDFRVFIFNR